MDDTNEPEFFSKLKDLQDQDVRDLSRILNVQIDYDAVAAERAKYPDEPFTFEQLAMAEFSPELARVYIAGGNHWTIPNVFPGIVAAAPELELVMTDERESEDGNTWTVSFTLRGEPHEISVEALDHQLFFIHFNGLLERFQKRFMYIDDFEEGGLHYLLVSDAAYNQGIEEIIYQ